MKNKQMYKNFYIKYLNQKGIEKGYSCDTVENLLRRFITDKQGHKPNGNNIVIFCLYNKGDLGFHDITYSKFLELIQTINLTNLSKYEEMDFDKFNYFEQLCMKIKKKLIYHLPNTSHGYYRKGIYKIEDVLPYAVNPFEHSLNGITHRVERNYDGNMIYMDSHRYQVFNQSLVCCKCGLVGQYFAKETFQFTVENPRYHFNLYAVDDNGEEVLMTKDHIIPVSKGGKDILENYQTMCEPCNKEKGNKMLN